MKNLESGLRPTLLKLKAALRLQKVALWLLDNVLGTLKIFLDYSTVALV